MHVSVADCYEAFCEATSTLLPVPALRALFFMTKTTSKGWIATDFELTQQSN